MATSHVESYRQTFTSFGGCDICVLFNGRVIGEIQQLSYNVTREKAPIYTLGDANPRSFSRNKRGIAGTLVFTVFDADALIREMKKQALEEGRTYTTWGASALPFQGMTGWDEIMSRIVSGFYNPETGEFNAEAALAGGMAVEKDFEYPDQIPPFNITVVFQNEYGQAAKLELLDVEILNSGMGFSVDDTTTELACTFICRDMRHMRAIARNSSISGSAVNDGGITSRENVGR